MKWDVGFFQHDVTVSSTYTLQKQTHGLLVSSVLYFSIRHPGSKQTLMDVRANITFCRPSMLVFNTRRTYWNFSGNRSACINVKKRKLNQFSVLYRLKSVHEDKEFTMMPKEILHLGKRQRKRESACAVGPLSKLERQGTIEHAQCRWTTCRETNWRTNIV